MKKVALHIMPDQCRHRPVYKRLHDIIRGNRMVSPGMACRSPEYRCIHPWTVSCNDFLQPVQLFLKILFGDIEAVPVETP